MYVDTILMNLKECCRGCQSIVFLFGRFRYPRMCNDEPQMACGRIALFSSPVESFAPYHDPDHANHGPDHGYWCCVNADFLGDRQQLVYNSGFASKDSFSGAFCSLYSSVEAGSRPLQNGLHGVRT